MTIAQDLVDEAGRQLDRRAQAETVLAQYTETSRLIAVDADAELRAVLADLATIPDPAPPAATFPIPQGVVIGKDRLAQLAPCPSAIANHRLASLTYVPGKPGTTIDIAEQVRFREDAIAAKLHALRWADTGIDAHRAKVIEILTAYAQVTTITRDGAAQYRLEAGWAVDNFTQACSIIGQWPAGFERFLVTVCVPILCWTTGVNWQASFAASLLGIAVITGDRDFWVEAVGAWEWALRCGVYVKHLDGPQVRALAWNYDTMTPLTSTGATVRHWGGEWGVPLVSSSLIATSLPDGTSGEYRRNIDHVVMGMGAFVHGGLTIELQGQRISEESRTRLVAMVERTAKDVLAYLTNAGQLPSWNGVKIPWGGDAALDGWHEAVALFGSSVPTAALVAKQPKVLARGIGGNHLIAGTWTHA